MAYYGRGNKCRFWQIFVEALKEFLNLFIQSETSVSTHEYTEHNHASKYIMLPSNFGVEHCGLSPSRRRDVVINWYLLP